MRHRIVFVTVLLSCLVLFTGCLIGSRRPTRNASSALNYLFPNGGVTASLATQVNLHLPVRVGIAFAPGRSYRTDPVTEDEKQRLLQGVADAFKSHEGIGHIEVVPSAYLQPGGSFTNLDQIRSMLNIDLIVLLSYDQAQFTDATRASWTYLTVVGPLLVSGDKNDTRTLMDAVVYDIQSRTLLFRSAGESTVKGWTSPVNVDRKRRTFAAEGFRKATDNLIVNLNTALAGFAEEAKSGTVQGPGTPAVAMYNPEGERIPPQPRSSSGGGGGGGALGGFEIAALALLGLALAGLRQLPRISR
jgi:rhombotail lipoprotein